MKFPLRIRDGVEDAWCRIYDDRSNRVAMAPDRKTGQEIIDALTLQYNFAQVAVKIPAVLTEQHKQEKHETGRPEPSKAVVLGSIPAADMTYRQWLIGQALAGAWAQQQTVDDVRLAYRSSQILHSVDSLLARMERENET